MDVLNLILGIFLLVSAVFLIIAVLMQSGKSHNLSGSIAGGAETFFGKTKGKTIDKMLSKLTTVISIIFVIIVIVVYVIQPETGIDFDKWLDDYLEDEQTETTTVADTTAEIPEDTTSAEESDIVDGNT